MKKFRKSKTAHLLYLFFSAMLYLSTMACKDQEKGQEGIINSISEAAESVSNPNPIPSLAAEDIKAAIDSAGSEGLLFLEETEKFYTKRNFAPAWASSENRTSFYEELQKAEKDGLSFNDYHGAQLKELMETSNLSKNEGTRLEILLTDAYLELGHHLYYGKINPEDLHRIWDVKKDSIDVAEGLEEGLEKGEIEESMAQLRPQHEVYKGLRRSLAEQREENKKDEEEFEKIPLGGIVRPGEQDKRIPVLKERLEKMGLLTENLDTIRNNYTKELVAAVKEFQEQRGLTVDGILGNSTIKELNMNQEDRLDQILVNLERWRWYPRDLGNHYILINIPQYKLSVVKENDTIREHDIIAGTKSRQTPIFSDSLQYIVLNPTWTLPPTIKTQDVIPKAAKDPSYITRNNMYVSSPEEGILDPHSIDWSSPDVRSYTFTQRAGSSNPLGRVKIIYPNRYSIYLHDTPSQWIFEQNARAASSGCVRVEDALDLSAYVMNDQEEWDQERIQKAVETGKTKQVKIKQPIQVHHFYWTAWRDRGKTVFVEDVYELDKKIAVALKETD